MQGLGGKASLASKIRLKCRHSQFNCPFQAYCNRGMPPGPTYLETLLPGGGGRNAVIELAASWASASGKTICNVVIAYSKVNGCRVSVC